MGIHSLQTSFNAGELAPALESRITLEKYANGCRQMKNMMASIHGPTTKRPGTVFMGSGNGLSFNSKIIGLNFSGAASAILQVSPNLFKIWSDNIIKATVVTKYQENEIQDIQFAHINDIVYITHPDHPVRVLSRISDTNWKLREIHEPLSGWTTTPGAVYPPATGNAVVNIYRYYYNQYETGNEPIIYAFNRANFLDSRQQVDSSIQHNQGCPTVSVVRAWFIPKVTGLYKFSITDVLYFGQVSFNPAIDGSASTTWDQYKILVANGAGTTAVSPTGYSLVAGKAYWSEYVVYKFPSGTSYAKFNFKLSIDGGITYGADVQITKDYLAANTTPLFPPTGPLADLSGYPALLDENILDIKITPSATTGEITLTSSAALWNESHIGAWWQISHHRDASSVKFTPVVSGNVLNAGTSSELRIQGEYTVTTYGNWSSTLYLERYSAALADWEILRSWVSGGDRNVIETLKTELEGKFRLRVLAGASVNPAPYFTIEASDSSINGLVRIVKYTNSTTVTAQVYRQLWTPAATTDWSEGAWSSARGNPRTLCLHEQRMFFAGTFKSPQSIWGSTLGDFENFVAGTYDDSSMSFEIASAKSFAINWMISNTDLIIGTSLDEWVLGSSNNGIITPSTAVFRRQSAYGSAFKSALLVESGIIFQQRNALGIQSMSFGENDRYQSSNISLMAPHLTYAGVTQMAWQGQRQSILWCVTTDGKLSAMTYENKENVFAWHQHITNGRFISVATIFTGLGDEIWFIIERSGVFMIEKFDNLTMFSGDTGGTDLRRCYTDSSILKQSTTAFTTVEGLSHLAGKTVSILADGAQQADVVVSGGGVATLQTAAKSACVGLKFTSVIQPMKIESAMRNGTSQGRTFKIYSAMLRLIDSLGGNVADSPTSRKEYIQYRTVDMPMDVPPPIFSGDKTVSIASSHRDSIDITITHDEPLPFTLSALVVRVDIFDE